jgi:hypothetical protein
VLPSCAVAFSHDQLLNQDPPFNVIFIPKVLKVNNNADAGFGDLTEKKPNVSLRFQGQRVNHARSSACYFLLGLLFDP